MLQLWMMLTMLQPRLLENSEVARATGGSARKLQVLPGIPLRPRRHSCRLAAAASSYQQLSAALGERAASTSEHLEAQLRAVHEAAACF